MIEECSEYIEDPDDRLARNGIGQHFRIKVKVSLSYEQMDATKGTGIFKNV